MKDKKLLDIILDGVALAMGVAVIVLSFLGEIDADTALILLAIACACLSFRGLQK